MKIMAIPKYNWDWDSKKELRICSICGGPGYRHTDEGYCVTNDAAIYGSKFKPILDPEDMYLQIVKLLADQTTYLELMQIQEIKWPDHIPQTESSTLHLGS